MRTHSTRVVPTIIVRTFFGHNFHIIMEIGLQPIGGGEETSICRRDLQSY